MKQVHSVIKCVAALLIVICVTSIALSDEQPLPDTVPAGVVKRGPLATRDPSEIAYTYFLSNSPRSRNSLVAREIYRHGTLIKRELFKNGLLHGIQRSWYRNGVLKDESPYRDNIRDGMFRHWDEQGRLVGQYSLTQGTGTLRIYSSTGELIQEESFKDNRYNGLAMKCYESRKDRSFVWYRDSKLIGNGYSFFADGLLQTLSSFSDAGEMHGPYVRFDHEGKVLEKLWFIHGEQVSEEGYTKAAAITPSLPAHIEEVAFYRENVPPDIKKLFNRYSTLPKVKIPLEVNQDGNFALANKP